MENQARETLKDKKRIVIKIGSSSLTHPETGDLNLAKIEKLVRVISDLRGMKKEVVLVSSGAIAVGRQALGCQKPTSVAEKQAFLTKNNIVENESRINARNTFDELLKLGTVPIVNENDTVSTYEIKFGDNDRLSAIVSALIEADLLILLSDIDGLYSDDPKKNPNASFISQVDDLSDELMAMGKSTTGSDVGTGGMSTKLYAARIATDSGADMVIANGDHVEIIWDILAGKETGTLFTAHKNQDFVLLDYMKTI